MNADERIDLLRSYGEGLDWFVETGTADDRQGQGLRGARKDHGREREEQGSESRALHSDLEPPYRSSQSSER